MAKHGFVPRLEFLRMTAPSGAGEKIAAGAPQTGQPAASEWRIFFTIVLPMATAALAALIVFIFLFNWDNFLWPLVVLNSPDKQTLPLVLAGLRSLYWTRYEMWAAGSMLTVVPVILIYIFASKQFIRGLAMTGLKA